MNNADWKHNILMNVFNRMGKTLYNGKKYTLENVKYQFYYGEYMSYKNNGRICDKRDRYRLEFSCLTFSQVDLTKYLTPEEIKEIEDHRFKYTPPIHHVITIDDYFTKPGIRILCKNIAQGAIIEAICKLLEKTKWRASCFNDKIIYYYNVGVNPDHYTDYAFQEVDMSKYFTDELFDIIKNDKYLPFDGADFIQKQDDEPDFS